jgi:hypothetical protein
MIQPFENEILRALVLEVKILVESTMNFPFQVGEIGVHSFAFY